MSPHLDVVLTGHADADAAARGWARARARAHGEQVRTVGPEDLAGSDAVLAVVGRTGHADADAVLALVAGSRAPVVTVSTAEPLHPATELADDPRQPVAVGVPTEDDGLRVLDVAADEAYAVGTDLMVIRVWRESEWVSSVDRTHTSDVTRSRLDDAQRLDRAVVHVHHRHPDLDVMSEFRDGSVYDWLRRVSRRVECLVLGTGVDGRSAVARWAVEHLTTPVVLVDLSVDRARVAVAR